MGQGVPRQGDDIGGHRPPRTPRHHLRDERRELPRTQGAREKAHGGTLGGERQSRATLIDACSDNQQGGHASVNQNGESSDNQKYLAPGTNQDDHYSANRPSRPILI